MPHISPLDGASLRAARKAAGLSQAALAAKSGTSQGDVSKWERGEQGASPLTVLALAEAIGCEFVFDAKLRKFQFGRFKVTRLPWPEGK